MFINTFKYSPRDVDCKLCTEYARKNACTAERCLWLSERIEADVVGYEEVLLESFPKKSPFRWRLRLLVDLFSGTLWNNEKHSPHVAGGMRLEITRKNCVDMALANLTRYLAGQPLENQVKR